MTVVDVRTDTEQLTFTLVAEFAAPPERVWQVWSDPRQLERWWGPPTWPATFDEHDFVEGGGAKYHMTGPEGEKANGWWRFLRIDEPSGLELEDGFADGTGEPDSSLPVTRAVVELVGTGTGTRMTVTSHLGSLEELERLTAMGMVEGMTLAAGQIDGVLAA